MGFVTVKIALLLWPVFTVFVVSQLRPALATATLLLGAILLLPTRVAFDFPLIPPIGREEIAALSLLAAAMLFHPGRLLAARPGLGAESLVLVVMLAGVGTAYTNGDSLTYGPRFLPGISPHDSLSNAARDFMNYFIPFFLARAMFRSQRDLRDLMMVIAAAGLLYSLPILLELRLSPQLNRWIYGFFPHSFHQHVRAGGYRPMVFMPNGLAVSQFMAVAMIAAASLMAVRTRVFAIEGKAATAFLASIVVACKSAASIVYAGFGLLVVQFMTARMRTALAVALAALAITFPLLRGYGYFPTDQLVAVASEVSALRAHSLNYRFVNEDLLLEKAQERILFGWGGFNRSRVYDERRGGLITITDGYWIIQLGQRGILGSLPIFGMITLPVLLVYRRLRHVRSRNIRSLLASLALIVSLAAIDLLVNGLFTYLPIVLSGALLGVMEGLQPQSARSRARKARKGNLPESPDPSDAAEPVPQPSPTSTPPPSGSDRSASLAAARRKKR